MSSHCVVMNEGQRLVRSNYWDSEQAQRGLCMVSINAGAFRLLVPDKLLSSVADMETGKHVVISRGFDTQTRTVLYEVMFDDGSDSPFALWISPAQFDRHFSISDAARKNRELIVYRRGCVELARFRAYFRDVATLPCLKAVGEEVRQ